MKCIKSGIVATQVFTKVYFRHPVSGYGKGLFMREVKGEWPYRLKLAKSDTVTRIAILYNCAEHDDMYGHVFPGPVSGLFVTGYIE